LEEDMSDMVSVVMPVYNGSQYLAAAIDSVLNQSYENFEFLIIDDGSTEDVFGIVDSYSDNRIFFLSRENRGLGATLNQLVESAKCELIFRMDADDICTKQRLELQVNYMKNNPDVAICGGAIDFLVGDIVVNGFFPVLAHADIRKSLLEARFPLCHPSVVFRKSVFNEIGGYRLDGAGEDLDFFLRMSEIAKASNVPDLVLHYRLSVTSLALRKAKELEFGYAYALYSANLRNLGQHDLGFGFFKEKIWPEMRFYKKIAARARTWSEFFYRKSIICSAYGRPIARLINLILASLLRPNAVISRVMKIR